MNNLQSPTVDQSVSVFSGTNDYWKLEIKARLNMQKVNFGDRVPVSNGRVVYLGTLKDGKHLLSTETEYVASNGQAEFTHADAVEHANATGAQLVDQNTDTVFNNAYKQGIVQSRKPNESHWRGDISPYSDSARVERPGGNNYRQYDLKIKPHPIHLLWTISP